MRIFRAFENSGRFLGKKMVAKGEGVLCVLFFLPPVHRFENDAQRIAIAREGRQKRGCAENRLSM